MAQNQNNVAAERAAGAGAGPGPANQQGPARRVAVLNALPLSSLVVALRAPQRGQEQAQADMNDLESWIVML
jgi:hypothetical protein